MSAYSHSTDPLPETDEEGFLLDPSDWTPELAETIAHMEDLPLTDERWLVVRYVRDHFEQRQSVPTPLIGLAAADADRDGATDLLVLNSPGARTSSRR